MPLLGVAGKVKTAHRHFGEGTNPVPGRVGAFLLRGGAFRRS